MKSTTCAILLFCFGMGRSQTMMLSVNDLINLFNSDIAKVKTTLVAKGFKIDFDGDKFKNVAFYQWYHGRTSHNADAFVQRYVVLDKENYNWKDDCLEYIIYDANIYLALKKQCTASRLQLIDSGQKEFTVTDSYTRDPGIFSIYQSPTHWVHFNAVQEDDKMVYKILIRKRPE